MPVISGSSGSGLPPGGATSQVVAYGGSSGKGSWVYPPGTEWGYDQITAPVTVTSATEATPTTIISCAAHTFDGAAVIAHFFCPSANVGAAAGSNLVVCLWEGATELGQIATMSGASVYYSPVGEYRFTPSVGSHTYTVTAFRNNTQAIISAGSGGVGAQVPAFIRFTKA